MKKKQIIFLESYATVMFYKIAKEFKKKGYETILIRILKPDLSEKLFYNNAYNKVIDINLKFVSLNLRNIPPSLLKNTKNSLIALKKILALKPYVIFGRSNPNFPIAFFRGLFRKKPFIYFPYDIRVHWVDTLERAKKERNLSWIEMKSERFNFEHSDGILHKGAPNELEHLNGRYLGNNIKLPKDTLYFHPYCSNEFITPINKNKLSKKDKEIHVVCLASGGKRTKELYEEYFNVAKPLLKQNIHFHAYISKNIFLKTDEIEVFKNEYKDYPNIKYFHIHDALNPKDIVKEVSKYDFGFYRIKDNIPDYDLDMKFAFGNKISTYLEAGIPFFYPNYNDFMDEVMKRYKLNLTMSIGGFNDIKDLSKVIKKLNLKELEKDIEKARKDFNMEKQFPRLENFIKQVVKNKSSISHSTY
jgi:hypothetical protein